MRAPEDSARRAAHEALAALAAEVTGFSREAILPDAIRRVVDRELAQGGSVDALIQRAREHAEELVHALQQAVSVGETYFFRHPEQFLHLADEVLPRYPWPHDRPFRVWSAGCATGEETYSLAAMLRVRAPAGVTIEVLGTDLLERNVAGARAANYGRWSVRASGPELFPLHEPAGKDRVKVLDAVRQHARFHAHNLLGPPPGTAGSYDLVFCRNVLVYFSQPSAKVVIDRLSSALVEGGHVFFGPMDLPHPPQHLVRAGPPELQVFRKPRAGEELQPKPAPKPPPPLRALSRPPPPPPMPLPAPVRAKVEAPKPLPTPVPIPPAVVEMATPARVEPVAVHLKALGLVERGDDKGAAALLDVLCHEAPGYVPGLTERALLHVRQGSFAQAAELMRQVLKLTALRDPDEVLAAPEPTPVSFYAESAEAFLESRERR